MGSGDKHHNHNHNHYLNFQLHLPRINSGVRRILSHIHFQHHNHQGKKELKGIPEGCLAVKVGQEKEQQRFIIPVDYINHPLFVLLLAEVEEEYGFDHDGPINIPCPVEEFIRVKGLIHKETNGKNSKIHGIPVELAGFPRNTLSQKVKATKDVESKAGFTSFPTTYRRNSTAHHRHHHNHYSWFFKA